MSSNPLFDTIEDQILQVLETGAVLPRDFRISLAPDQMVELLRQGMQIGGKRLPLTTTRFMVKVGGHDIWLISTSDPEPWITH